MRTKTQRGAVDRDEQRPASLRVGHLRQVLHIDVQIAGLIGLEGFVRGLWPLRLEVPQAGYAMAPQAAVEPRARQVRMQEFPHRRK